MGGQSTRIAGKEIMSLDDHIRWCIWNYPTLYRADNYEDSRLLVLHQMFLVIGNGYEWRPDGTLTCDNDSKQNRKTLPKGYFDKKLWTFEIKEDQIKTIQSTLKSANIFHYIKRGKKRFGGRSDLILEGTQESIAPYLEQFGTPMFPDNERLQTALKEAGLPTYRASAAHVRSISEMMGLEREVLFSPYPISDYSAIDEIFNGKTNSLHVENFDLTPQPEYLKACIDVAKAALAYYQNPEHYKNHIYHYSTSIKREEYDFNQRKKTDKERAELRKLWGYIGDETIEEHCKRVWNKFHKEQIKFLGKFLAKFSICPRCEGDGEIHDADFSQGDSDHQMYLKQDTLRDCPVCTDAEEDE
jgi:hypothetical protein